MIVGALPLSDEIRRICLSAGDRFPNGVGDAVNRRPGAQPRAARRTIRRLVYNDLVCNPIA
jgi:hypothetical protein